jgi:hypothetical protein
MLHVLFAPLLTFAAIAPDDTTLQPVREAHVEVHVGRAVCVRKGAPERTLRRGEPWVTQGENHLEVGAGAEVQILWPGRGSLQVWGPASLQWGPLEGAGVTGPDDLAIRMFELSWADLEMRRGTHELHLPGNWRAQLGEVAIHIRGLPSGPVEIRHHAGRPVRLDWRGAEGDARPPITVYPGSNVRLDRPAEPPGADHRNVNAWKTVEWPWRNADTWSPWTRSVEAQIVQAPALASDHVREPEVRPQEDQVATVSATPSTPVQVTVTAPETEDQEDEASVPAFDSRPWRGIALANLAIIGPVVMQRSQHAKVRSLASGRWMIVLDTAADETLWVFGSRKDFQLKPGARVIFEANGVLGMHTGRVRVTGHPPFRPPHSILRR